MNVRGRPPLNLPMPEIIEAIRRSRRVTAAAAELGCSPAYIHARLKAIGLSLGQLLEGPGIGNTRS